MDFMAVEGTWRDPFPKLDLNKNFIGDGYPLCIDLPSKHFLRIGATYRLMGSAVESEMLHEYTGTNYDLIKRFQLDSNSNLYGQLCNYNQSSGACDFRPLVTLDENLDCYGQECDIDNLTVLIVSGDIKYEYVRPACVDFAFHDPSELKKVVDRSGSAMCLHSKVTDVAMPACCIASNEFQTELNENSEYLCEYSLERSSYDTTRSRCQNEVVFENHIPVTCDWTYVRFWDNQFNTREGCSELLFRASWHWTNQSCRIMVKGKQAKF